MRADYDWPLPPGEPGLEPDAAHLWRVSLDAPEGSGPALAQTLSADERQRADRFRFEADRRRFVVGRGALRALLGQYGGCAPAGLTFVYGPHGKPSLAGPPGAHGIFFNASRSDALALVAITRAGEIGVDLERVRALPEWREIARRVLTGDPDAAPPATLAAFFREWTRHEARLKASGLGLGGQPAAERTWDVRSLALEPDLVAAVALPAGVRQVACWSWCGHLVPA